MSDATREPAPAAAEDSKLETEIRWLVRRLRILWDCWTAPVNAPTVNTFTRDDGVSARSFALLLIVALAFAVRGDRSGTVGATFTALAGALAVVMSFVLNMASKTINVSVPERMILSAYTSTIVVMIAFVLVIPILGWNAFTWVEEYLDKHYGPPFVATILAVLVVFAILLAKASLWDKQSLDGPAVGHAAALTGGSGLIVLIVYSLSSETFGKIVNCLKDLSVSCLFK